MLLRIGNRLRSNDGVDPLLASRLAGKVRTEVLDVGDTPENYHGPLMQCKPNVILAIDAVRAGGNPGEVSLISPGEITDRATSTHDFYLRDVLKLLSRETGAPVLVLGIQPATTRLGENLSRLTSAALIRLEELLLEILGLQEGF